MSMLWHIINELIYLSDVQQREGLSPVPGEEQPHAPVYAGGTQLENNLAEKALGVLGNNKLTVIQQRALAAMTASDILGWIRSMACRLRSPFPHSAPLRSILECCAQF